MDGRQTEIGSLFDTIGDFRITDDALDAANEQMGERTNRSQRQDRRQRAPVTTDYQTWASDTDHWDFPSVDTPRQDPRVKPKDLKQSKKPRTTDPNTGESRAARKGSRPAGAGDNFFEQAKLSATDVSLAPDEAFGGVGATSASYSESASKKFGTVVQDETARYDKDPGEEEAELAEIARRKPPAEAPQDDLGFFYQSEDVSEKATPTEFKREVRRKKREMGGLADDFAAAGLVADDLGDD